MRKLFMIAVLAALPTALQAQSKAPTKQQKEYFARQVAMFELHLKVRANAGAAIECDSVVPQDCFQLAARSMNRRDQLLTWHSFDQCTPLRDMEKLICLNEVSVRRENRMGVWRSEWRQHWYR